MTRQAISAVEMLNVIADKLADMTIDKLDVGEPE